MNQSLMAGLGNIYSDEVLFQAGIHPGSSVRKLSADQVSRIFYMIGEVIDTAIDARVQLDNFPGDYLINYREPDASCPRCGGKIKKQTIASRSSYLCKQHQKLFD
jgi:formamidopyrimidine-DNA glycosylase